MNTTDKKTSLYDSVTKSDNMNVKGEDVRDRLDSIPRGEILTAYKYLSGVYIIFIYNGKTEDSNSITALLTCYPYSGKLTLCSSFKLNEMDRLSFATQGEKEILLKKMKLEGYIWSGWDVKKVESDKEEDVKTKENPTEEQPSTNGDKNILDKAIENKIAHNIKVAKDILDNTLPYYVINDNIEQLVRTTDKSLKRDLNNFNYFTNKEDVDEAIRRVKETLMNFQEEIQNRNN